MLTIIATLLLTTVFFMAGLKKVQDFDGSEGMIAGALNLNTKVLAQALTVLVIALELLAPIVILYALLTKSNYNYAYLASMALAVFTLVTAFVVYYPVTADNQMLFMLHLSLAGGMILLGKMFKST